MNITYQQHVGAKLGTSKWTWSFYLCMNKWCITKSSAVYQLKKFTIREDKQELRNKKIHILDHNFNRNNIVSFICSPAGIVVLTKHHDIDMFGEQHWLNNWRESPLIIPQQSSRQKFEWMRYHLVWWGHMMTVRDLGIQKSNEDIFPWRNWREMLGIKGKFGWWCWGELHVLRKEIMIREIVGQSILDSKWTGTQSLTLNNKG